MTSRFFKESSTEEREHAEKLMEYQVYISYIVFRNFRYANFVLCFELCILALLWTLIYNYGFLMTIYQNKRGGRVKLQSMLMPCSEFDHAEKGDALNGKFLNKLKIEVRHNLSMIFHVNIRHLLWHSFLSLLKVPIHVCDSNTAMELALALEKLNNEKLLNLHKVIYFLRWSWLSIVRFRIYYPFSFLLKKVHIHPKSAVLYHLIFTGWDTVTYRRLLIFNYRLLMKTMMCN